MVYVDVTNEDRAESEGGSEAESPGLTLTGTQLRQNDSHS